MDTTSPCYLVLQRGALFVAGADVGLRFGDFLESVLHAAAQHGYIGMMRAVIEHRADVDAGDKRRNTHLFMLPQYFDNVAGIGALVQEPT